MRKRDVKREIVRTIYIEKSTHTDRKNAMKYWVAAPLTERNVTYVGNWFVPEKFWNYLKMV